MSRMFSERIQHFVLSADTIEKSTFDSLLELVAAYMRDELDITYFSVREESMVDADKG